MLGTQLRRLFGIAQSLALNGIPVWGVLVAQWATPTALALYWWESLFGILLIALRIRRHRALTHKLGHYRAGFVAKVRGTARPERRVRPSGQTTLLGSFLTPALLFTLAHGVFLAALLLLMFPQSPGGGKVDGTVFRNGALAMSLLMLLDFGVDQVGLAAQPFAWIRRLVDGALGRMMAVHLTILLGMVAVAFLGQPSAFFLIFAVLKTMADLSSRLPQYDPPTAPTWLTPMMNRIAPGTDDFAEYWQEEYTSRHRHEAEDEQVVGQGSRPKQDN